MIKRLFSLLFQQKRTILLQQAQGGRREIQRGKTSIFRHLHHSGIFFLKKDFIREMESNQLLDLIDEIFELLKIQ